MTTEIAFSRTGNRFSASIDGAEAGFIDVDAVTGSSLRIKHTEVDKAFEGKGIGGKLVRHVLDQARRERKSVIPACPFAAEYIRRHPEYLDIVEK